MIYLNLFKKFRNWSYFSRLNIPDLPATPILPFYNTGRALSADTRVRLFSSYTSPSAVESPVYINNLSNKIKCIYFGDFIEYDVYNRDLLSPRCRTLFESFSNGGEYIVWISCIINHNTNSFQRFRTGGAYERNLGSQVTWVKHENVEYSLDTFTTIIDNAIQSYYLQYAALYRNASIYCNFKQVRRITDMVTIKERLQLVKDSLSTVIFNKDSRFKNHLAYKLYGIPFILDCDIYNSSPMPNHPDFVYRTNPMTRNNVLAHSKDLGDGAIKVWNLTLANSLHNNPLEYAHSWIDKVDDKGVLIRTISDNHTVCIDYVDKICRGVNSVMIKLPLKPVGYKRTSGVEDDYSLIGSFDLETYSLDDGEQYCYLGGFKINNKRYTTALGEVADDSQIKLIIRLIDNMFLLADHKSIFYCHNLNGFDSVFILNTIGCQDYEFNITWGSEQDLLSIKIKKGQKYICITDSMNYFSSSLNDVAKSFKLSTNKLSFPHRFVRESNLNYVGVQPDRSFYDGDFVIYKGNDWSLLDKATEYLNTDLDILSDIMINYSRIVWKDMEINLSGCKTISSLAMRKFRNTLNHDLLKIPTLAIDTDIRNSYYGGTVWCKSDTVVNGGYHYDVVSQYPSAMLKNAMPIGDPVLTYPISDLQDFFGFVYAKVIPNRNLQVPILPRRDIEEVSEGIIVKNSRVFYDFEPTVGWYFSEELKNAEKYGYIVTPEYGYAYSKDPYLFHDYVTLYSNLKNNATDPVEISLAKMMLNSLYGRLGMGSRSLESVILDKKQFDDFVEKFAIYYYRNISDRYILVVYNPHRTIALDLDQNPTKLTDHIIKSESYSAGSISVASAITAYARISMSRFKNMENNTLYYTDTDSLVLQNPLDDKLIGKNLGDFKLENRVYHGLFIKPKQYAYYTSPVKSNENLVRRLSGGDAESLSYTDYLSMFNGNTVTTTQERYFKENSKLVKKRVDIVLGK